MCVRQCLRSPCQQEIYDAKRCVQRNNMRRPFNSFAARFFHTKAKEKPYLNCTRAGIGGIFFVYVSASCGLWWGCEFSWMFDLLEKCFSQFFTNDGYYILHGFAVSVSGVLIRTTATLYTLLVALHTRHIWHVVCTSSVLCSPIAIGKTSAKSTQPHIHFVRRELNFEMIL